MRNVIAWIGFNRTTDSNKIEVIVLDDQKSRELRRIRTTGLAVLIFVRLYDIVNIHSNADMSKLRNRKNDIIQGWGVLQSLISPSKGNEKERSYYHTGYSFLVTHPGTNPAKQGSTLLSGRHVVLSLWYRDSEHNCF